MVLLGQPRWMKHLEKTSQKMQVYRGSTLPVSQASSEIFQVLNKNYLLGN